MSPLKAAGSRPAAGGRDLPQIPKTAHRPFSGVTSRRFDRSVADPVRRHELETTLAHTGDSGRPLDPTTRGFLESSLHFDFSHVRVHRGDETNRLTHDFDSIAMTAGWDIFLSSQIPESATLYRSHVLAHEAAHVIQQQRSGHTMAFRFPANTPAGDPNAPGVDHAHTASGSWSTIQGIEVSNCLSLPHEITCACAALTPMGVVSAAVLAQFSGKPLARLHLAHYLTGGGADFTEDAGAFIPGDSGVRSLLASEMAKAPRGHFKVEQDDYLNQDFRFAFGAIDRLDYRVDSSSGVVYVWFVDRYEWHPVYSGVYTFKSGDDPRITNCVHAALVELKSTGARDFWMVGYGAIPVAVVTGPSPGSGTSGGAGATTRGSNGSDL